MGKLLAYRNTVCTFTSRLILRKSTGVSPGMVPTIMTSPPLLTDANDCMAVTLLPAVSKTMSAPSPPNNARLRSTVSSFLPFITCHAPNCSAFSNRRSITSATTIRSAPIRTQAWSVISPIQPAPNMSTFFPGFTPASSAACMPTAAGSTSAPSTMSICAGRWYVKLSGCVR